MDYADINLTQWVIPALFGAVVGILSQFKKKTEAWRAFFVRASAHVSACLLNGWLVREVFIALNYDEQLIGPAAAVAGYFGVGLLDFVRDFIFSKAKEHH